MKKWVVTVPTRGYIVYEVKAATETDARKNVQGGKGKITDERHGEWDNPEDWMYESFDE